LPQLPRGSFSAKGLSFASAKLLSTSSPLVNRLCQTTACVAHALWEGCHGYDSPKYAAMLREAFELFDQFTATTRSLPDSLHSDLADDLSRSPLFAALRFNL
jgi:hypothetical protein